MRSIKDATAIVGVATTELSKDSGRTEYSLACEVIKAAADDAGIPLDEIDGMVKDTVDGIDAMYLQKALGMETLMYSSDSDWGTTPMLNAVTAIASGTVNNVVYFRSANNSSGKRAGSDFRAARETKDDSLDMIRYDFYAPFGLLGSAGAIGMSVRRYYDDYGIKPEQVGWVPVVCSEHAAGSPEAIFHDAPLDIDDYLASAMIVDPLRELDCAPQVDGAMAIILTSADRARDLRNTPAYVRSVAFGSSTDGEYLSSYQRETLSRLPEMELMGRELFRVAELGPEDVGVAQLDDQFAPLVPMQLEALGFCGTGEGGAFCEGGDNLRVGGRLALNTAGGFIGQGYSHGLNIIEAVRQIRSESTNQVDDAEVVLVATGAGGPADGAILSR